MIDILTTRFQPSLDDKHLREAITVRPEPVLGLENLNRYVAAERLSETLKKVFIPTAFTLDLIQEMLGRAQSFSVDNFSTEQQYLSCLYNPPAREVFPICFTGLAGVGKSATITALRKVLPSPQALKIDRIRATNPTWQKMRIWFTEASLASSSMATRLRSLL
ncbi:hypothetical protein, partial [Pseudomonas syringae]